MNKPRTPTAADKRKKSLSMHDDIPVWYDCCSCAAEPYWQNLADEEAEVADNKPEVETPRAPSSP